MVNTRQSREFVSQLAILCVGGLISLFAVACGGETQTNCGDDQAPYEGQCVDKCEKDLECASGDCANVENKDFSICLPGDGDAGTDTGVPDDTGQPDPDTGQPDPDTGDPDTDDPDTGGDTGDPDTGGDAGGPPCPNPGNLTCSGVYSCVIENQCSDQDNPSECIQSCKDQGNCAAQQQFDDLITCQQDNCSGQDASATCTYDQCGQQYNDCGLVGEASCKDTQLCRTKCQRKVIDEATGDETEQELINQISTCISDTCDDGSLEAQKKQTQIVACSEDNNCSAEDASPTCRWDNCNQEYQSCGVLGSKSCTDIDVCIGNCGSRNNADYECEAECLWTASAQARAARSEVQACQADCRDQHFPQNGDPSQEDIDNYLDCIYQNNCTTQLQNCGSGKVGSQHSACSDISTCLSNCSSGDVQCRFDCRWDATGEAQAEWSKGYQCLIGALGSGQNPGPCLRDCVSGRNIDLNQESCKTCLEDEGCTRFKESECNLVQLFSSSN